MRCLQHGENVGENWFHMDNIVEVDADDEEVPHILECFRVDVKLLNESTKDDNR